MIEENDIQIEDDPNPERLDAIRHACQIFADVARYNPESAPRDENDMDEIVNGILSRNGDLTDSLAYTIEWRAIREKREEATRREAEQDAQQHARTNEIAEFKRPASRSDAIRGLRAEPTGPSPAEFVPRREYTEEEMENMSSDAYRRLVLGHVSIDDRQGRGNDGTVREQLNALILADKVLNRAVISKTRSIRVSPEELAAREQRARVIAADQAERRRLEQERRKK